ncbi:cobalamin synthesis protein P47K [Flammeovirgaceae bacterium 311]|nr:cobalamin synthesis protein P47K [Flammeovirgaceae bacterium 311]
MSLPISATPVTIVTGFLGSGKTTLINELTAKMPQKKFAVIENEFGETGIDKELLIGNDGGVFEINGGCICCTVSGELISWLLNLNKQAPAFDHLIIETTGVAEPLSIAEPFLSHPLIAQKYRLDAIICLLDSELVAEQLRQEEVVARQISAADLILFNKTGSVTAEFLAALEVKIRQINPFAQILHTQYAKVGGHDLTNLKAFNPESLEKRQLEVSHHHHHLHDNITSYSICFTESLDYGKFYQWASQLMTFQNSRIYRIKGILNFNGRPVKVIFQSVKNKFVMTDGNPWPEGPQSPPRESRLVFIGRELKKEILLKHLKRCFAKG